ncbi:MAG: insulinase family protein [Candidatus Neomarinimicrobiota bacterium]
MKPKYCQLLLILTVILIFSPGFAQSPEDVKAANLGLNDVIPIDPDVMIGEFENGVDYYIRVNKKPENRAMLWLVVNAGSLQEDDDQLGLAHFTEHMGFNGTQHFEKNDLIDYLESIGMRFGPEINAYTSFDETAYFLQVPTDSAYFIETGFQMLEDWAHLVSFEDEEIDKERGVVIEEWRLRQGAQARMRDKQLPILFKNSRYAERLPIGNKEILDSFAHSTLKKYYEDWYRSDLMAIVAVGDFGRDLIFTLIEKHFALIPALEKPRERKQYPVPDHDEVLYAIATDIEATQTQIGLYFKSDIRQLKAVADYRIILMEAMYNGMLNDRLMELTKKSDPPFIYGYSAKGRFVRSKEVYLLGAGVKEDGIEQGLKALLVEAKRAKKHGFTETELERVKTEILRQTERGYVERDKMESSYFAQQYVDNFLTGDPILSLEQELALYKQLLPGIHLLEINELADRWITSNNRVVLVSAPQKDELPVPSEDALMTVITRAEKEEVQPFTDLVSDAPLMETPPKRSEIVVETVHNSLGITELTLANGVHVVLKPTDFKNDEILFDAYSIGGNSLVSDKNFMSANFADQIIQSSGIGAFNDIELEKKLAGKVVNVAPYFTSDREGLKGAASPRDIETMFKLIHLYMTAPRKDEVAYNSLLTRMKAYIRNRNLRPETAFFDTLNVTLAQYHWRSRPLSEALLNEIDHEAVLNFYRDRFADAGDFHFFFTGNFEVEKIKPLIQTYLGGLPSVSRTESWKDNGIMPPEGVIKKEVYKGIEPKSIVQLVFTGSQESGYENYYARTSLVDVLRIKLREVLREDRGGTYGVRIGSSTKLHPRSEYSISIRFGCDPERVDEMIQTLFNQIAALKTVGPEADNVTKVRETHLRSYEVNMKKNSYWLREMKGKHYFNGDLTEILEYPDVVATLSEEMIRKAALKYLNIENYVQVVLFPEKPN